MESCGQRRGGLIPVSPSHTPRSSDKAMRDLRSGDGNSNSKQQHDKERGVNVQVLLRCRPLSDDERRSNTPVVISCNEQRREVTAVQNIANKQIDRTFAFDKVFGPTSQQKDLYEQAVSPIVHEVLDGYNCTIFAYGQTGTGKTYTMEGGGGRKPKNGEFPSDAGVIPRAVGQIFDILEAQNADYSMKVTFLELYNEEITDLLAVEEGSKFVDDKTKKQPIALMDDGKGAVFVRGLEEEIVSTAYEIYKILDKGSAKRRTAETLLNKQSSRSHSIFSITIHIKECTPEGEEFIKCGKLNLVDLAGSENISRSGAREGRAREAGEINKSLLTLGRVINALVDHSGHVPYRDSKLTRLLRDSLGGKTKTCIIATISPSVHCLEETLSTLDYAHRAKHIKNKPEVNQKMMKSAMIKDLYAEIDRLKQELSAAREKNGIYIPQDRYLLDEAEKKAMTEKIERLEQDSESKEKQLIGLQELCNSQRLFTAELSEKFQKTEEKLEGTRQSLLDLEERYGQAQTAIKEKEFLISNLLKSEKALIEQTFEIRSELDSAASDITGLFTKIERKDKIEDRNRILLQEFQSQLTRKLELLHNTVEASVMHQEQQLKRMEADMQSFVSTKADATEELKGKVEKLKNMCCSGIRSLDTLAGEIVTNSGSTLKNLNLEFAKHSSSLEDLFKGISSEACGILDELQNNVSSQEEQLASYAHRQEEAHCRAVDTTRCISRIIVNFLQFLDDHASKLTQIVEETESTHQYKLSELEKKFEECVADEERRLLEKMAEMLASSSARKKNLVQAAVESLREGGASKTGKLLKEMSTMQDFTSSIKDDWAVHVEKAEAHYNEDMKAVESGKNGMEEALQNCMAKVKLGAQQWNGAQESLISAEKSNAASADSIIKSAIGANQTILAQLSLAASHVLEDLDSEKNGILASIENSLKLDHEACENIDHLIDPCHGDLNGMKYNHCQKVVEIKGDTGKYLEKEYMVDEPSCFTPRKRSYNIPSTDSINELKTLAFEDLLKSFRDSKSAKHLNGDVKHLSGINEAGQPLRDSRSPLTTIN